MNQFASISSDGQVLLWEKKFLDAHKKPVTDVPFSSIIAHTIRLESWLWLPSFQA